MYLLHLMNKNYFSITDKVFKQFLSIITVDKDRWKRIIMKCVAILKNHKRNMIIQYIFKEHRINNF